MLGLGSLTPEQRIDVYCQKGFDPIDYLLAEMEANGWRRSFLAEAMGSRAKVSDVLKRRRGLSVAMIRRLVFDIGLSPHMLLRPIREGRS